jgi:hypothetical protein
VVRPPARIADLTGLADPGLGGEAVLVRDGSFLGVVAGAIGNAVADAVGVRVRDLPLTRGNVTRAIQES